MKPRLTAVLLHGMGHSPSWWASFVPRLEEIGIAVRTPTLPDLEAADPSEWVQAAVDAIPDTPTILMGHSLGAAAALRAAWQKPVQGVILLAMPVSGDRKVPRCPTGTMLSLTALSRVGRFLLRTAAEMSTSTVEAVHLVGECDMEVDMEQARQLPIPLIGLPGADHNLNRLERDIRAILACVACTPAAQQRLDPAIRRSFCLDARQPVTMSSFIGQFPAPPPARLDVEVTTRCQLRCAHCARTLCSERSPPVDMDPALFERLLDEAEFAEEVVFVGLGEPLLHPELERLVSTSKAYGLRSKVVTNGLAANRERLLRLRDAGLQEVTFSIDSTDDQRFASLRGGAALATVLRHFQSVPPGLQKSVFSTLSRTNAAEMGSLAELARVQGLPVLAVSDVNFEENVGVSLSGGDMDAILEAGILTARAAGILVLGPHLHELSDPTKDYRHALVRSAADLSARATRHTHCLAPWRIAVVGATGEMTPCNCAPQYPVGFLGRETLKQVWDGTAMTTWRTGVQNGTHRPCLVCPRF